MNMTARQFPITDSRTGTHFCQLREWCCVSFTLSKTKIPIGYFHFISNLEVSTSFSKFFCFCDGMRINKACFISVTFGKKQT